jgi:hypothetical protein
MSNKKITDLTELVSPTIDDVFPVVDIATNTTQKAQLGNLPVQTAVTTALATKQATLVSGTNIKTINSTSVLGSGNIAVQETLVSGTNIKTINSTSLLGSGNITIAANPSGVSGAIQFSNGSAFASDAANFFWDDTNNRLGVGTNSPSATAHFKGSGSTSVTNSFVVQNSSGTNLMRIRDDGNVFCEGGGAVNSVGIIGTTYGLFGGASFVTSASLVCGGTTTGFLPPRMTTTQRDAIVSPATGLKIYNTTLGTTDTYDGATWQRFGQQTLIKGSGSTSATTSLLVQNSGGNTAFQVRDDRTVSTSGGDVSLRDGSFYVANNFITSYGQSIGFYGATVASAIVEIQSTTKGFLPPRMTTTQKNAIASPAAGLVVYDSTTNKLCCYNGSTWNDLF